MLETKKRDIDGFTFTVMQLPGKRGLRLWRRLGKILGPSLARAAASASGQVDFAGLAGAVEALFDNLTETELDAVVDELTGNALVLYEGSERPLKEVYDVLFAGRVETQLKLLMFALEVNYSGFFVGLRALVSPLLARAGNASAARSSSPTTSLPTGQPLD